MHPTGYSAEVKIAKAPDGAELASAEEGAGEPLLLIAGQATGMAGWGPTAGALAQHFRVSVRSSGDRRQQPGPCRPVHNEVVCRRRGCCPSGCGRRGRARVWPFDGWPGRPMGRHRSPHRVRALVLAATSGGRRQDSEQNDTAMAALLSGDVDFIIPLFFVPEWANQHPDATRSFFDSQSSAWAKSRLSKASREHEAWGQLISIQAPTLILHGTADVLTPLWNGTLLHQHIRRSTLVRVPGARHGLVRPSRNCQLGPTIHLSQSTLDEVIESAGLLTYRALEV